MNSKMVLDKRAIQVDTLSPQLSRRSSINLRQQQSRPEVAERLPNIAQDWFGCGVRRLGIVSVAASTGHSLDYLKLPSQSTGASLWTHCEPWSWWQAKVGIKAVGQS